MVPVNEELRMAQESKKSQRKEVGRMTETNQSDRQPRGTLAVMTLALPKLGGYNV
jgi:hypothetical protein